MVLSKIIVDTSAYSAFMRGEPRAIEALQLASQIFVPQIVVGELAYGFEAGPKKEKHWQVFYRFLASSRSCGHRFWYRTLLCPCFCPVTKKWHAHSHE